jgi:hypothetical protein
MCTGLSRPGMRVPQVSLQMVFARKSLVAAGLRTGKRPFLVVTSHVCFETAGSVEALAAAVDFADEVPLPTSLAVCSACAVVGEVDFLVCRIV